MEAERDEAVAEVPDGRREGAFEDVASEVEVGEGGSVAELKGNGADQGVDTEVKGLEVGELAKLRRERASEGGSR